MNEPLLGTSVLIVRPASCCFRQAWQQSLACGLHVTFTEGFESCLSHWSAPPAAALRRACCAALPVHQATGPRPPRLPPPAAPLPRQTACRPGRQQGQRAIHFLFCLYARGWCKGHGLKCPEKVRISSLGADAEAAG